MSTGLRNFFLDVKPQDGIASARDYPYLIMLRYLLAVVSSWPQKTLDPLETVALQKKKTSLSIQRFFQLALCLICNLMMIIYVWLHISEMTIFKIGHLYISILMNAVIFSRITTICYSDEYVGLGQEFLEKIHLLYFKDRSEYSMKIHKQVHRISHLFTLCLVFQMFAVVAFFNVTPMYNNYLAGNYARGGLKGNATYEHALYYSNPFNTSTELKWYIANNIYNWSISYWCATWFCMLDCFLSLMVFHMWGHFKILLYNLDNFPRPSSRTSLILEDTFTTVNCEMFSPDEQKNVSVQLRELIEYHHCIINFTDKMSGVFGPMLFAYYVFHQISGCLLLLECSQMTTAALTRYLPLTVVLFQQLIQLSIIFELIGSISDQLKNAVYGLPWECMDTKNRRTVAFFLMNVKEPVHVKALGVADVGVTSMTAILKTSISYFTFLRTV